MESDYGFSIAGVSGISKAYSLACWAVVDSTTNHCEKSMRNGGGTQTTEFSFDVSRDSSKLKELVPFLLSLDVSADAAAPPHRSKPTNQN